MISVVQFFGHHAVAKPIELREQFVHCSESSSGDGRLWNAYWIRLLGVQLEGQLHGPHTAPVEVLFEQAPLEALDVKFEQIDVFVTELSHGL